jgi:hypothetical protein
MAVTVEALGLDKLSREERLALAQECIAADGPDKLSTCAGPRLSLLHLVPYP